MPAQLAAEAGLSLSDIDNVILTHCHGDHTGGLFAPVAEKPQAAGVGPSAGQADDRG
jgi:glyoxylase-like metal-dependent hydrolase (beta-lactamase superfamily II)